MTPPVNPPKDLLESLLQLQTLEDLPRTGWCQHGVPRPESVAGHGFGTALLALALGPSVQPELDTDRAVSLALLHDVGEAWTGDLPRRAAQLLPPGAKASAEAEAARGILSTFPAQARERAEEILAGESREARFVHACDRLQLGLRLLGYLRAGQRGLEDFRETLTRLDCLEFAPCEALRTQLLAAIDAVGRAR